MPQQYGASAQHPPPPWLHTLPAQPAAPQVPPVQVPPAQSASSPQRAPPGPVERWHVRGPPAYAVPQQKGTSSQQPPSPNPAVHGVESQAEAGVHTPCAHVNPAAQSEEARHAMPRMAAVARHVSASPGSSAPQ